MKYIKKHIKLIVFLLTFLSIYLIYTHATPERIVYTTIGDEFSLGFNSYKEESYSYSDFIAEYFKKNDCLKSYYDEFNSKDMMIKDLKNNILLNIKDSKGNNIKQVLRETNILTISIGINDFIYKLEGKSNLIDTEKEKIITEIVESLDDTIKEIQKYCKGNIYLIGYYNVYPQNSVEKTLLDQFNMKYKQISVDNHIIFINNSNMNANLEDYLDNPDTIYPNIKGYRKISSNIIDQLDFIKKP